MTVIDWWLASSRFDPMAGGDTTGPPEWPRPGGLVRQDARLVEAVGFIRSHWRLILVARQRAAAPEPKASP